jgi:putative transposase
MDIVTTKKKLRLPADAYAETAAICSINLCVKDRARVFSDKRVATAFVNVLMEHAARTAVTVYAYCVMPDHVHLVLSPSASCDLVKFVGQVKSLALRSAWGLGVVGTFWQKSFWDHFLRVDEALPAAIAYVLENPVRARLVARWDDYEFSGSIYAASKAGDEPRPHNRE